MPISYSEAIDELKNNIYEADNVTPLSSLPNVAVPDYVTNKVYGSSLPNLSNACQVARITINGTEVEEIMVAEPSVYPSYTNNARTEDTMAIVPHKDIAELSYSSNNFGGSFYVNSSTTFIYVPQDRTKQVEYAKKSLSSFKSGKTYWVQPYNVNSSNYADLVVVYGTEIQTTNVKPDSQAWLLAANHNTIYDNDEQVYEVSYYANSETATTKKASLTENNLNGTSTDIGDISIGDFFRAGTNSSTGLVNAEILLDYDDVKTELAANCDFTHSRFDVGNGYFGIKVANVVEVVEDSGKYLLTITQNGFVDGALPDTITRELVEVTSNTIIYRISDDGSKITPYVEGSDTERITTTDFREAKYNDASASKIAIYSYTPTNGNNKSAKMILIYE